MALVSWTQNHNQRIMRLTATPNPSFLYLALLFSQALLQTRTKMLSPLQLPLTWRPPQCAAARIWQQPSLCSKQSGSFRIPTLPHRGSIFLLFDLKHRIQAATFDGTSTCLTRPIYRVRAT